MKFFWTPSLSQLLLCKVASCKIILACWWCKTNYVPSADLLTPKCTPMIRMFNYPIWHIYFAWNIYNYCIKTDAKSKYTYSYDYFHPLLCLLSHKSKVCELYIWIVCINLQCVNFWAFLILIELAKDFGTI